MIEPALVQSPTFSGHESFPIRFTWLTKTVRLCEAEKDRDLFSRPDAMVALGVGKNMVRSMRSWGIVARMIEPDRGTGRSQRVKPTALGASLFGTSGLDPFMEDPATIWIIHWSLASNRRLGTWFWVFNELRETEFERKQLVKQLMRASRESTERPIAEETIERDVDCFLRSYVPSDPDKRISREELLDCPLTELGLIRRSGGNHSFAFARGPQPTLPNEVFAFALVEFWRNAERTGDSLRFEDVAFAAAGPGQIFKMTENAMVDRLHALAAITGDALRYDDTAGMRQVFRSREVDPLSLLKKHYGVRREATHAVRR